MSTTSISRAIPHKLTELGRIRLGHQELNRSGNGTHPAKLSRFRLTSSNKPLLEYAAKHPGIGGEVRAWQNAPGDGKQWELYTTTDALDVIIPTFSAVSLSYERWSGAGCEMRCTGAFITLCARKEELVGTECICPADDQERGKLATDGKACARILRLNVMLPDLPGTGFWRMDTRGFYATAELLGTLDLLKQAGAEHLLIDATLRLEQRTVKRSGSGEGKGTFHFAVPVLWPRYSFRQIAAAAGQQIGVLERGEPTGEAAKSLPEHISDVYGDAPIMTELDDLVAHRTHQCLMAIETLHVQHGYDGDQILRYWVRQCRRFGRERREAFTLPQAEALLRECQAHYAMLDAERGPRAFPDAPDLTNGPMRDSQDTETNLESPSGQNEAVTTETTWRQIVYANLRFIPEGPLKATMTYALADTAYSDADGNELAMEVSAWVDEQDVKQSGLF